MITRLQSCLVGLLRLVASIDGVLVSLRSLSIGCTYFLRAKGLTFPQKPSRVSGCSG